MSRVQWNQIGEKEYESGIDQGVIYLPDGSSAPWNGLTAISEQFNREADPVYFDGVKISDVVSLGTFSANISALTYPQSLDEMGGIEKIRDGVYLGEQPGGIFGLCYRTRVGNDLEGSDASYKIHIIYNVTAIPADADFATAGEDTEAVVFNWALSAVPEQIEGHRPSSHLIIKTAELDPYLVADIERILYGDSVSDAALVSMAELIDMLNNWFRIRVTDNGDGTWTAHSPYPEYINWVSGHVGEEFIITGANVIYTDSTTFVLSDTKDLSDIT